MIHPFDVSFAYFTRLERGPIPEVTDRDKKDEQMAKFLLAGCIDRDPIQAYFLLLWVATTTLIIYTCK